MGKVKGFMLNRKQYQNIRKMDHCQMTLWAEALYKNAFRDGRESAEGLTSEEIREVLLNVKGIGEKRVEIITAALNKAMEQKSMNGGKIHTEAKKNAEK